MRRNAKKSLPNIFETSQNSHEQLGHTKRGSQRTMLRDTHMCCVSILQLSHYVLTAAHFICSTENNPIRQLKIRPTCQVSITSRASLTTETYQQQLEHVISREAPAGRLGQRLCACLRSSRTFPTAEEQSH